MKKTNQNISKQHIFVPKQSQQVKVNKKLTKVSSRQLNHSPNLRFFQSHPFSQGQRQQFTFARVNNCNYTDSSCQPQAKEYSRIYRNGSGPNEHVTSQNIVMLQERLKNICQHYEAIINQERIKSAQRSEIIMGLISEMQSSHAEKMDLMRKTILESKEEKKDVGYVDEKMNKIKGNIDQLIKQSNTLKQQNQQIQRKIEEKIRQNEQKEAELQELNQEVLEARTELEQFQLANLKNNRINKEIMQIFNSATTLASN